MTKDVQVPSDVRRHPEFLGDPLATNQLVVDNVIEGRCRFVRTDCATMKDLNLTLCYKFPDRVSFSIIKGRLVPSLKKVKIPHRVLALVI